VRCPPTRLAPGERGQIPLVSGFFEELSRSRTYQDVCRPLRQARLSRHAPLLFARQATCRNCRIHEIIGNDVVSTFPGPAGDGRSRCKRSPVGQEERPSATTRRNSRHHRFCWSAASCAVLVAHSKALKCRRAWYVGSSHPHVLRLQPSIRSPWSPPSRAGLALRWGRHGHPNYTVEKDCKRRSRSRSRRKSSCSRHGRTGSFGLWPVPQGQGRDGWKKLLVVAIERRGRNSQKRFTQCKDTRKNKGKRGLQRHFAFCFVFVFPVCVLCAFVVNDLNLSTA